MHKQDEWTRLKNQREATSQPLLPKPTMCTPTPPLAEPTITLSEAKKLTINVVKQVLTALATDKILSIDPTMIAKYLPQGDTETPTPTPPHTQIENMETAEPNPTPENPASKAVLEAITSENRTSQETTKQNEPRSDAIQPAAEIDPTTINKPAPIPTPRTNRKIAMFQNNRRSRQSQEHQTIKVKELFHKNVEGYGTDWSSQRMFKKHSTPKTAGRKSPKY